MAKNRQKYAELSLAGKWIKLAQQVVADHPGMTESEYLQIASPFMPTHIRSGDRKAGKVELAMRALRSSKMLDVIDGKIYYCGGEKTVKPGLQSEILEHASSNGTVRGVDLPHIKDFSVLATRLVRKGFLKKDGRGVFSINSDKKRKDRG